MACTLEGVVYDSTNRLTIATNIHMGQVLSADIFVCAEMQGMTITKYNLSIDNSWSNLMKKIW